MHICPVDCHWCIERQCAAEGCMLCGEHVEPILSACLQCGDLFVMTTRIHICAGCLRQEVLASGHANGD